MLPPRPRVAEVRQADGLPHRHHPRITIITAAEFIDLGSPEIVQAALAWRSLQRDRGPVVSSSLVSSIYVRRSHWCSD